MLNTYKGNIETRTAKVAAGVTIERGDAIAINSNGEAVLCAAGTKAVDILGVAGEDQVAGENVTYLVPRTFNTTFEIDITGGPTVAGRYIDFDSASTAAAAAGTEKHLEVISVLSDSKAEVRINK